MSMPFSMLFAWLAGTFRYLPQMSGQAAVGRCCDFSRPDVTLTYATPSVTSTLTGVWPADIVPDMLPERVMLKSAETLDPPCVTTAETWKLVAFFIADFTCLGRAAASGAGPAGADTPGEDEPPDPAVPEPPPLQPATSSTATAAADPADQRKALMDVSSPRVSETPALEAAHPGIRPPSADSHARQWSPIA